MAYLSIGNIKVEYKENPIGIDVINPRFFWQLTSNQKNTEQKAYQIQVSLDPGFATIYWDSGKKESDQSIHVVYEGPSIDSCTRYFYRVRVWDNHDNDSGWSETQYFETAFLDPSLWKAKWITPDIEEDKEQSPPAPYLRKEFILPDDITQARVYITALGLYQLEINGERATDVLFAPGWTSYHKRIQYQTYDVTSLLQKEKNAIGVILGDGWYRGDFGWRVKRNNYGDTLALLLQLHVTLSDGTSQTIISDTSWKAITGPIIESDIYNGEVYDARLELGDWSSPGYNDESWSTVSIMEGINSKLIAQQGPLVRKIEEIKPIELIQTPAGEQVIDFGQNFVGWIKFRVTGKSGDRAYIEHGEVLDKEGNFYNKNLKLAKARIEYILKGDGEEVYEPHFTFHGFRYARINNYPGEINLDNFTGIVFHSDMQRTGYFECSNPMVNRLFQNIIWGHKGNFLDIPTDCPQRCERMGWTGDAQVFAGTAVLNMNVATFFAKWLADLHCDQKDNGGVPFVVPDICSEHEHSSSAWSDAATICPWQVYLAYGDKQIFQQQYESMKAWVEYIRRQGDNEFLWNTGYHIGDWLAMDAKKTRFFGPGQTCTDFIATAFYAYSTYILYHAAEVLGLSDDYKQYKALYHSIVEAFQQEFITPTGRLAVPTQTAHALALRFNLMPDAYKKRCIDDLVQLIKNNKGRLETGFVGTPHLCFALSDNGYPDVAYELLLRTDFPSWLYPITKGATTMWEHWDSIKPDGSFQHHNMNSFNHYAYGAIGEWMYKRIGGIDVDPQNPGFKHFFVKPVIGEGLDYAQVTFDSMYGRIKSGWKKNDSKIELNLTIPANTKATVILPKTDDLTVNGESVKGLTGVNWNDSKDQVEITLGSGDYRFEYSRNQ
jgi:alpha-L-rhamnosidase